jgi:hypothetical protein
VSWLECGQRGKPKALAAAASGFSTKSLSRAEPQPAARGRQQGQALLDHGTARPALLDRQAHPLARHPFQPHLADEPQKGRQARSTAAARRLPIHAGVGIQPILHRAPQTP